MSFSYISENTRVFISKNKINNNILLL